jgi:hypothetical protein
VIPSDLLLARGAEGALGIVHRDAEWQAVDNDIQKGSNACTDQEDHGVKQEVEKGEAIHAGVIK